MSRLREEIKPSQALNLISLTLALAPHQNPHIASLCMHIAADVDNPLRSKVPQLSQEIGVAAFTRGIQDDSRLVSGVGDVLEELACVGGNEFAAVLTEAVELGVLAGGGDGVGGDVDARRVLEYGGQGDCEEARAGVGVDEVLDG